MGREQEPQRLQASRLPERAETLDGHIAKVQLIHSRANKIFQDLEEFGSDHLSC